MRFESHGFLWEFFNGHGERKICVVREEDRTERL